MKNLTCGIALTLCFSAVLPAARGQGTGYSTTVLGSQYIEVNPNQTTVIVPQFVSPGSGLLTESGITSNTVFGTTVAVTNGVAASLSFANNYATGGLFTVSATAAADGGNYTLLLAGKPPVNSDGVPLSEGQYQYKGSNQPSTYFALVTAGTLTGNFFTLVSNTDVTLVIDPKGLTIAPRAILAINLLPYWTLSSLFPSSMSGISFVATTNLSDIKSRVVISPPYTVNSQQPQAAGQSFYFDASISAWASATNPGVPAGDAIVAPGAYVYFQNTNSGSYPLYEFISGKILTGPFNFYFTSSDSNTIVTYFGLPRNSSYKLTDIGFNNRNFTQSDNQTLLGRNDLLILDDGHGGIGATYYEYKNRWYDSSSDALPTNPTFPPGSVWGVLKQQSGNAPALLVNIYNEHPVRGLPAASIFTRNAPGTVPGAGVPVNPPNSGGD